MPGLRFSDILQVIREHYKQRCPLLGHPDNSLRASVFPLDALTSGFAAKIAQLLIPRAQKHKAGGMGSKAPFSSGDAALATCRGMLPPTGPPVLGPIKAGGSSRRAHGTARNPVTRLLSARHLVGRLLRR